MTRLSFHAALTAFALVATPALAATNSLGLDTSLNLLAFGDFTVPYSDVEGRVAVGGNARISSYSINATSVYAGAGLTVAGNLDFLGGTIHGNTVVGGNLTSSYSGSFAGGVSVGGNLNASAGISAGSVAVWGGVSGYQPWYPAFSTGSGSFNLGYDFVAEQVRLTQLSTKIDGEATTGSAANNYGTLVFNASNANGLNVFDISAADAGKNMQITGLGANGVVIINVHGATVNFGNHGYTGFDNVRGQVLFNLPEATSVSVGYLDASLLAPLATVTGNGGLINGQVVVDNWATSVQVNDYAFTGSIPLVPTSLDPVPEPQTWLLVLAGFAFLAAGGRIRQGRPGPRLSRLA